MNFKLPSINKLFFAGNLLDDPDSRIVSNNAQVTNFKIAGNKRFRDSQGMKDKVCYVNIVAWSKLAEICAKVLRKGDGVFVEGELQNRQTQNGMILEVLANRVEFLTKRNYHEETEITEEFEEEEINEQ